MNLDESLGTLLDAAPEPPDAALDGVVHGAARRGRQLRRRGRLQASGRVAVAGAAVVGLVAGGVYLFGPDRAAQQAGAPASATSAVPTTSHGSAPYAPTSEPARARDCAANSGKGYCVVYPAKNTTGKWYTPKSAGSMRLILLQLLPAGAQTSNLQLLPNAAMLQNGVAGRMSSGNGAGGFALDAERSPSPKSHPKSDSKNGAATFSSLQTLGCLLSDRNCSIHRLSDGSVLQTQKAKSGGVSMWSATIQHPDGELIYLGVSNGSSANYKGGHKAAPAPALSIAQLVAIVSSGRW